MAVILKITRLL